MSAHTYSTGNSGNPAPVEAVWHALSDNDARDQWFSAGSAPLTPGTPGHSERQSTMTIVTAQMSVSADGFYAGQKHTDMATWLDGPEAAGFFRVTRWAIDAEAWRQRLGFKGGEYNANSEVFAETFDSAGAYVMGRRMADGGEIPWGDDPPFRAPVFVVTSRPRQTLQRKGGTSFTYITAGIHSAIEQARTAANGKNVAIAGGGTLLRQVIKLGEDVKRSTAGARLSSTTEDETTSPPLPKPTARQLQPRPT